MYSVYIRTATKSPNDAFLRMCPRLKATHIFSFICRDILNVLCVCFCVCVCVCVCALVNGVAEIKQRIRIRKTHVNSQDARHFSERTKVINERCNSPCRRIIYKSHSNEKWGKTVYNSTV